MTASAVVFSEILKSTCFIERLQIKLISKPHIGLLVPNLGPHFFLWVLPLLDIRHVTSYQCFQFKEKLMIQALENGKKPLILTLI